MNIPRFIFFDLDNTLVDHTMGLVDGLRRVCQRWPWLTRERCFDEVLLIYERINEELWSNLAAGNTTPAELRLERFRRLTAELPGGADGGPAPELLSDRYMSDYVSAVRPYEGVVDLLTRLRAHHTLGVISNGFADTQRAKLSSCGLDTLLTYEIYSEEVGAFKPDRAIFRAALAVSGAKPEDVIYVGDNFESDIAGASGVGMTTVWFNPAALDPPHCFRDVRPGAVVRSIAELSQLLAGNIV